MLSKYLVVLDLLTVKIIIKSKELVLLFIMSK